MTVFVDTSYFIARMQASDQWHAAAVEADDPTLDLITSNDVVNETITLLRMRGFLSLALDFLREIRAGSDIHVVYVDAAVQAEAWDLYARYAGLRASGVDCTSFAMMRRLGIKKAFTFDQHFRAAGFGIVDVGQDGMLLRR
ncbi:MAG: PIN domain-containing protein [Bryobacteraceae bacterium]